MIRSFIQGIRQRSLKLRNAATSWSAAKMPMDHILLTHHLGKKRPSMRQLLHLPLVLNAKERLLFTALLVSAVATGFYASRAVWNIFFVPVPARGGVYTEGIVGSPRYVNPLYAPSNAADLDLVRLLFSGLIRFNERGEVEPDLAERIEVSDDAKEYTIVLKEGLTWSDGEPVTSEDVRFTVEAAKNPLYQSPLRSQFANVMVESSDERTVRFVLNEPSVSFMENLTLGLIPSHLWSSIDPRNATLADLNTKPVSVGPFEFDTFTKDAAGAIRSYTIVSRKDEVPRPAHLTAITFKYYQNIMEAVAALTQKNIDGLHGVPPERLDEVKTRKDLERLALPLPQYVALFYRQGSHPALDRLEVRRALTLAIDREKIVTDALHSEGRIVDSPFVTSGGEFLVHASSTPHDPGTAQKLLEESGWKRAEESSLRKNSAGEELAITITTLGQEDLFHAAEIIQKNWQAMGVKTTIQIVDAARVAGDIIRPRSYQALLIGELTGYDPDPYPFWHSSQIGDRGLNLADYTNRDVDRLLEEARKTNDQKIRGENYQAIQIALQKDNPAAFLYTSIPTYLIAKKIQGVVIPALAHPSDRFTFIEQWFTETRWGLKPPRP